MSVPWDAVGVTFIVLGLAGFPLVRWVCRWAERDRFDAEVAAEVDDWDADAELWELLVDEGVVFDPLPVSDEELLDVAHVAGVVPGDVR